MVFKILKGKHWSRPFRFWVWFRKTKFNWRVKFTGSCAYNLTGEDQADTNKLCGVGYLANSVPMHWKDSARFGWRYDLQRNQIELLAYCYVNKHRIIKSICFIDIDVEYRLSLEILNGVYSFKCMDTNIDLVFGTAVVISRNFKNLTYLLGVYFGGNQSAPHDMYINLKRL